MAANPNLPPISPPAPQGMPGPVAPPTPQPAPPPSSAQTLTVKGCFKVDVHLNAIQVQYDPDCSSQITPDQLSLLADVRKTEAALKAIFFPDGLPDDLRLQNPSERWAQAAKRKIASGEAAASAAKHDDSGQTAKEDHRKEVEDKAERTPEERVLDRKKAKYRSYFYALFLVAQLGLQGAQAQPLIARNSLNDLKSQILTVEAGQIKNAQMRKLGLSAALLGIGPLVLTVPYEFMKFLAVNNLPEVPYKWLDNHVLLVAIVFLFTWTGAMLGTFLSFAIRNPVPTFDLLAVPEDDRMEPQMRLFYVGCLAVVFVLAFLLKFVTISIGGISSDKLVGAPTLALLIGVFCGLAERAIGDKLAKTADSVGK